MTNLQKISLFFVLFVLFGKSHVLGGCGSSKATRPETSDTTDSSHLYRTQPAQKFQEPLKSEPVLETHKVPPRDTTQTKELPSGGAGAGATAPLQQTEPSKNKTAKEESIEPALKVKPTIERQPKGHKNSITQPPPRSKKEAVEKRRRQKRQALGLQTQNLDHTVKSLQPLQSTRLKKKSQVATTAGSRDGTKSSSKRQGRPRVAFSGKKEGAGTGLASPQKEKVSPKNDPIKNPQKLPPLPLDVQRKQMLLISVTSPEGARADVSHLTSAVLKPKEAKPLQSGQDKTASDVIAPLSALQISRVTAEEEPKLTPHSPKKTPLVLEKPTEPVLQKEGALTKLTLDLPGQTPQTSIPEIGPARREVLPASSMLATLGLSSEESRRERGVSKVLEAMKGALKRNKSISLCADDLDLYEQALRDSKAISTRISTKNLRSHTSTHMVSLLKILAAAPYLREVFFEDPLDFVATEGAGKVEVQVSLGEMTEKLTASNSLQTISFHGLPREDQLSDFTYNFNEFIKKDKTRKFTVIFREVPTKYSAGGATTLKSMFTDERVVLKMKE